MATFNELLHNAQISNSPEAYEMLADKLYFGNGIQKDFGQALTFYRKAAELGSVRAQACVGIMYYNGDGVIKDVKMAKRFLKSAADQGSPIALRTLGWMCYNEEYDLFAAKGKAFEFWIKAAKLGDAESQFNVASSYMTDEWGEEQSYPKAAFWFMCASQNHTASQKIKDAARKRLSGLSRYVDLDDIYENVVENYRFLLS